PNLGKFTSTRATRPSRSATDAGSSVGSKRSTSPCSGEGALSLAIRRPLMSVAINAFLERFDADALHHVDEALGFAVALLEVGLDEALDHVRDVSTGERRPYDLPQSTGGLIPSDLDLVPLLAVLVDAEDADVPDVMVAAGVHAARDVQVELVGILGVDKNGEEWYQVDAEDADVPDVMVAAGVHAARDVQVGHVGIL